MALKSTIDLTRNDYISIFEFDIFTRLFQVRFKNFRYLYEFEKLSALRAREQIFLKTERAET